jgi:hypothetical protein
MLARQLRSQQFGGGGDGDGIRWRRVQAALEKFVQAPKNPERDGKVAWAKLSKETKEALKAALETKKFKEAIESEITDAAVVRTSHPSLRLPSPPLPLGP